MPQRRGLRRSWRWGCGGGSRDDAGGYDRAGFQYRDQRVEPGVDVVHVLAEVPEVGLDRGQPAFDAVESSVDAGEASVDGGVLVVEAGVDGLDAVGEEEDADHADDADQGADDGVRVDPSRSGSLAAEFLSPSRFLGVG